MRKLICFCGVWDRFAEGTRRVNHCGAIAACADIKSELCGRKLSWFLCKNCALAGVFAPFWIWNKNILRSGLSLLGDLYSHCERVRSLPRYSRYIFLLIWVILHWNLSNKLVIFRPASTYTFLAHLLPLSRIFVKHILYHFRWLYHLTNATLS